MQNIQFGVGHTIEYVVDMRQRLEVPTRINQQPTPRETWGIANLRTS